MPDNKTMTLDDFAESLINSKGYTSLTSEMRKELKEDIIERAHDFLIAKTIAKLSNEQAQAMSDLLDKNPTDSELQQFIKDATADTPNFVGDTLFLFRNIYLGKS